MKKVALICLFATLLCTQATAKHRIVTERDSLGNVKRIIELNDTTREGQTVADTLSVLTYENAVASGNEAVIGKEVAKPVWKEFAITEDTAEMIIVVVGIVASFGLPVLIVFFVFYFRYKNRKAKYRLVEQALASGQPLPEEFFRSVKQTSEDNLTKGIKNIFLGIGLFIFLWALTNFAIGCIGLLVMFIGFGQVVIHYVQLGSNSRLDIHVDRDSTSGRTHVRFGDIEVSNQEMKD